MDTNCKKKHEISFFICFFAVQMYSVGNILNIFTFYLKTKDDPSMSVHFVNLFSIGGFIPGTNCFADIPGRREYSFFHQN